jgi:hypothetical protein
MPSVKLLFIDAGGKLYRGYGREFPLIEWYPQAQRWSPLPNTPDPNSSAERVSQREAERCYPGSTNALLPEGTQLEMDITVQEWIRLQPELFDSYDGPITRLSPEEDAERATVLRELIKKY